MTPKKIYIEEKKNGYLVRVDGFTRVGGDYVYKATELEAMIEMIAEQITGRKSRLVDN